jgi:hypothetical protein
VRDIVKNSSGHAHRESASDLIVAATASGIAGEATDKQDMTVQQNPTSPNSTLYAAIVGMSKKVANDIKFEPFTKDYPDPCTVEEFVLDVAIHCNRSAEKAAEWIRRLKAQDIDTVGDLHRLQEEDWIKLNLKVFATRALRNALAGRQVAAAMTSPRSSAVPIESGAVSGTDHH